MLLFFQVIDVKITLFKSTFKIFLDQYRSRKDELFRVSKNVKYLIQVKPHNITTIFCTNSSFRSKMLRRVTYVIISWVITVRMINTHLHDDQKWQQLKLESWIVPNACVEKQCNKRLLCMYSFGYLATVSYQQILLIVTIKSKKSFILISIIRGEKIKNLINHLLNQMEQNLIKIKRSLHFYQNEYQYYFEYR